MLVGAGFLFVLIGLAGLALWLWALVDVLKRPEADWRRAGQDRLIWILVVIFLTFIGALLYLVIARPQLEAPSTT